ncbi:uncharacterized protein LOC113214206 [Frankliniella occidentalis]|uniref:Uncharacterized protein LOC113214206 n=1 Tax=Frankliniella occidentalis TaxID=133901 RepID=A0A6J1TEJ7_FRAOC|nr:uncharacterized protein LOC113214206 [Frankliniella occidentalis]
MALSTMKLVFAAVVATLLLVQQGAARANAPLDTKLKTCVGLAKQPGVSDTHPLTACISLSVVDFRYLGRDWHQFFVTCVTNKGTDEPSIYENWASKAADCVDQWANL